MLTADSHNPNFSTALSLEKFGQTHSIEVNDGWSGDQSYGLKASSFRYT
jgi:hypothetical protein